ncbi:unnamed protein product [Phaedon cochleariae]|uniref:Uncharacterized protein n=1 Tax=Phaedon cochleariae TaxID=80249 RepID=A0A9N9X353_PHACE|nr:unnamed protein product [Phaedon cochleariae]
MENMICPMCGSSLKLKQINFTIAIYICIDLKCPYPVNEQCLEVYRKLGNMNSDMIIPELHTANNNNSIESSNKNNKQVSPPIAEENKDFDLDSLVENTLTNLNNYINQNETPSTHTAGQEIGMFKDERNEQFQTVHINNEEHLDELESIFSELR